MTTEAEFNAVWDLENDNDAPWFNPEPSDVRHAMPAADGLVPCCGRRPEQLGHEWMTAGEDRVTCGKEPA